MAISILECDRIDRYQFEVFIGQVDFTGNASTKTSETDADNNCDESLPKRGDEQNPKPKYTVTASLEDVFQVDIGGHDAAAERAAEDQTCWWANRDAAGPRDSFRDIVDRLAERYAVDEAAAMVGARCVCYHVADKESGDGVVFVKPTINRGVICIFACVPKTLITILQKSPLELTVRRDSDDGDRVDVVGMASVPLGGPAGFTNAVARHFYENGYDPYTHVHDDETHDVRSLDGHRTIGRITVRLRLTCHGPETRTTVNQVLPQSGSDGPPQLQPVFVDHNVFDYPFDHRAIGPAPKVLYATRNSPKEEQTEVLNRDIIQMLHCQSIQEPGKEIPCACPCKVLLENVKKIIFDDDLQQHDDVEVESQL